MSQSKRARRYCDNIQATILPRDCHVEMVEDENDEDTEHIRKSRCISGVREVQGQDSHDYDRPIDYSNHNSSASSSDTECNVVEVSPDQLLYHAMHHDGSPSELDEDAFPVMPENLVLDSSASRSHHSNDTDSNVALNKNQIVALTTNLCHKIRRLAKYELVTKNGNGNSSRSSNIGTADDMNIPIPTPLIDLNALDAYTAFQLSKNYILQQRELEAVPEISNSIATLENVHHYEIQNKYGNPSNGNKPGRNASAAGSGSARKGHGHNHELLQSQHQLRRLSERHFPALIPPTAASPKPRKRCYVCLHSTKRHKPPKRTDTYFMCVECNRPLCAVPCFNEYHTQLNF